MLYKYLEEGSIAEIKTTVPFTAERESIVISNMNSLISEKHRVSLVYGCAHSKYIENAVLSQNFILSNTENHLVIPKIAPILSFHK